MISKMLSLDLQMLTLYIFKNSKSDLLKDVKSFSQSNLLDQILGEGTSAGAHNAVNDVKNLNILIEKLKITKENIIGHTKSLSSVLKEKEIDKLVQTNIKSLECLDKSISPGMTAKAAKSGISYSLLQKAFLQNGEKGIIMLLGEDVNGKPRVSKNKGVITKLVNGLSELNPKITST